MKYQTLLDVLLGSPTFWQGCILPAVLASCFALTIGVRARRRLSRLRLWANDEGSASAVETVLVVPIFFMISLLLLQVALLVRANFVVHYATYAAARAARTVAFPPVPLDQLKSFIGGSSLTDQYILWGTFEFNQQKAQTAAFQAACRALIPIAGSSRGGQGGQPSDEALVRLIQKAGSPFPESVTRRRIQYACSSGRTTVDVEPSLAFLSGNLLGKKLPEYARPLALPIKAKVTFEYALDLPVGMLLPSRQKNGVYVYPLRAEVTVM